MRRNLFLIILCVVFQLCYDKAEAQSKIIRKTVKKAVVPKVAPAPPPKIITLEVEPEAPPAPPPPPDYEIKKPEVYKGFFGWKLNTDLSAGFLIGRGSAFNTAVKLAFSDPLNLGSKVGLAEDAVEYKIGVGLALGRDANNLSFFSVPLMAETVIYLKEGSLFGLDPYVGGGFNFNLFGTDSTLGGVGMQLFGGVLFDFGWESGKTALSVGYHLSRVGSIRTLEGLTTFVSQPIVL